MKISQLKKIIRESIQQLKNEQVLPTTGCNLPVSPQGPFPGQWSSDVWMNKWENYKDANNLGCGWVKSKYIKWNNKLSQLRMKTPQPAGPPAGCNPKWQNMLNKKVQHVQTTHGQCI